jgi:hypothetical protein
MHARLRVGILPAAQHRARTRLWAALEEAFPVRFEGCDEGAPRGVDGVLALGGQDAPVNGTPSLTLHGEETTGAKPRRLALAANPALARPLRGALLTDDRATALESTGPDEVVLARLDGAPAWVLDTRGGAPARWLNTRGGAPARALDSAGVAGSRRVACAPAELGPDEALRERLRPGRCLALLALAHFLVELTAHLRPPPSPLRAAFVIDDPNLRRPRYGHIDYAELLGHARLHGYHLAVAMVPLDARLAHPRAIRLFRHGAKHLSLCVHGNDHDGPELGRPHSDARATAVVAQALRRTAAFERRTGVPVDRIMVPPHERLTESVARALHTSGFQALTTTRPYPWVADTPERSWLARPPGVGPLAGWSPVDLVAGGLPVLLRADFQQHPREDLALRAFLGQPLILYGHHDLLAEGPGALAEAAAQIDRLGEVQWSSLAAIAHAHTHTRPLNGSPAPLNGSPEDPRLDPPDPTRPALHSDELITIPSPPRRLTPLLRRLASEGRDRTTRARDRAAARAGRPTNWSGRR